MKSFTDLRQELEKKGIEVRLMENKNGVSGILFRAHDLTFKGQDVHFKTAKIKKQLERNQLPEATNKRWRSEDVLGYNCP